MSYQADIAALIGGILIHEKGVEPDAVTDLERAVEVPKDQSRGDFAFPCFRLSKIFRKPPPVIAGELVALVADKLAKDGSFSKVEQAGPYLNFFVNKADLASQLVPAILDGSFLAARSDQGERMMIEYSQPNTHKAFHVGHTRNAALGNALVNICKWSGFQVVAANYIGDVGTHIAKCLWYFREHYQGAVPETNRGEFLGDLYTKATEMLDFKLLSRCPIPRVVTARVVAKETLPDSEKLTVVKVDTGSQVFQVLCGGSGFEVDDVVPYAGEGARIGAKLIGTVEKAGVRSEGMICSEKEIGLSDDHQKIYVLPPETGIGVAIAEHFRTDALDSSVSVVDEIERRTKGVQETLKKLEAEDPEIHQQWLETRAWSMDAFNEIYQWLGCPFDHFFYESDVGNEGKRICKDYYEKGVLVKSEGAIGADLEPHGLPFFMLIKSDGTGLYATKDIALAKRKFDSFHIDKSVYVVDDSQSLHFQQLFKTLELMGYENAKACYHLAYGLVVLPDGKMSSRAGNIILFSELKHRLNEKIMDKFLEKYRGDWSDAEIEEAAKRIAVGTIKYGMLNQDNRKTIVFDLDEWTARTGNTGPYLMYAYARTRSILREVGERDGNLIDWSLLTHETERAMLVRMDQFHRVVKRAADEYKPQLVCIYLYDLAKDFSRMYDHCSVLKAESEALRVTRAALVEASGLLIQQGLALLGIETLERM